VLSFKYQPNARGSKIKDTELSNGQKVHEGLQHNIFCVYNCSVLYTCSLWQVKPWRSWNIWVLCLAWLFTPCIQT